MSNPVQMGPPAASVPNDRPRALGGLAARAVAMLPSVLAVRRGFALKLKPLEKMAIQIEVLLGLPMGEAKLVVGYD